MCPKWLHMCLVLLVVPSLLLCNAAGAIDESGSSTSRKPRLFDLQEDVENPHTMKTIVEESQKTCSIGDYACLSMAANDKLDLDAIKALHKKLDDDDNGNVDLTESDDFLREELKYASDYERRQKAFHRNNDHHISVRELWEAWLKSEVHNWTVEQTTEWLSINVGLPQYANTFLQHKVTGANLPRLAANNPSYLNLLGIKDPIHKQKIVLKAMDVVLFGPPKDTGPLWKDRILILLVIIIGISGTYAYRQHKRFKTQLNRMNRDMDSLQNAERALENLQHELEVARQAQESVITEKENLEKRLQDSKTDLDSLLPGTCSNLEVSQLKAEIEMLRNELQIAKSEVQDRCWSPPIGLQQWLQLTHEIENKSYLKKRVIAEKQLQQAREACEKLRKKRSSLVGAFVSTHGKSIDDVDRSIVEARTALNEVTQELQERVHRWKQIEMLCGFNIINNSGLQFLENTLYRSNRPLSSKGRINSQDDLDEDSGSVYSSHIGYELDSKGQLWKEGDSSGSETSRHDDSDILPLDTRPSQSVHFLVGAEISPTYNVWPDDASMVPHIQQFSSVTMSSNRQSSATRFSSNHNATLTKSVSSSSSSISRSLSQDISMASAQSGSEHAPAPSLASAIAAAKIKSTHHSDSCLDDKKSTLGSNSLSKSSFRPSPIKEQPSVSLEDDICSTDSSQMDDDLKNGKIRKRKLFAFGKRAKTKGD